MKKKLLIILLSLALILAVVFVDSIYNDKSNDNGIVFDYESDYDIPITENNGFRSYNIQSKLYNQENEEIHISRNLRYDEYIKNDKDYIVSSEKLVLSKGREISEIRPFNESDTWAKASKYIMDPKDSFTITLPYTYEDISGVFSTYISNFNTRNIRTNSLEYSRVAVKIQGNPIKFKYKNTWKSGKVTYTNPSIELNNIKTFLCIEYR